MYKRVNEGIVDEFEGFSYFNMYNEEEFVNVEGDDTVSIRIDGNSVHIYDKDIPNLIRALQAAYEHKGFK
jgi:uncharacterized protein involved in tellurium resistance